jgi:hypothetical protein
MIEQVLDFFRGLAERMGLDQIPSVARIGQAMDPVAWTLVVLLVAAVGVGVYLTLSTRRSFLPQDEVETTPGILLARLKQDPTWLSPTAIVSRLGAEATLELLEFGDQLRNNEWRYKWNSVREELLRLLSQQNAFGPTYALSRYYRSTDAQEPDTLRIRRTALIHKLGLQRHLDANADGKPAQLRVRSHPAEVQGSLGFAGDALWLMPDEPAPRAEGPVIEMEQIEFRTVNDAEVQMNIRRTATLSGGFRLHLQKRRNMWVVVNEEIEWVS